MPPYTASEALWPFEKDRVKRYIKSIWGCNDPWDCISRGVHRRDFRYICNVIMKERKDMAAATKNRALPANPLEQWMICREPGTGIYANEPNPKKLYDDLEIARRDAVDLSRRNSTRFYVLKVIEYVEPANPPMRWIRQDGAFSEDELPY